MKGSQNVTIPPAVEFPRTTSVIRGCGERSPGSLYVECALSPIGRPFEDFLLDPPWELLPGFDEHTLPNKPQFLMDEAHDVAHLVLWIGQEHYPWLSDFIEEARRFGISRKLSPTLLRQPAAAKLTSQSRLILAHPLVRDAAWAQHTPPWTCRKAIPGHDRPRAAVFPAPLPFPTLMSAPALPAPTQSEADDFDDIEEPCLFKLWELLPVSAGGYALDPTTGAPRRDPLTGALQRQTYRIGARTFYTRRVGETTYPFAPSEELPATAPAQGLLPGVFGMFPITGFALITLPDGSVNVDAERALAHLWAAANAQAPGAGLPWYHTDA